MIITSYKELIKKMKEDNAARIQLLQTYETIISTANSLAETYKDEPGIDNISFSYPSGISDYLLILVYLSEKGSIKKDIGSFIESLQEHINLALDAEPIVDAKGQTKTWRFNEDSQKVIIIVNAEKSKKCTKVLTDKMEPIYEFICEDE